MLKVNQLYGFGARIPNYRVFYQTTATSNADASSYTFSSQPIGVPTAGRSVHLILNWADAATVRTLTSVTVGGITATIVSQSLTTVSNGASVVILYALVPTGSAADVVVTFSGAVNNCTVSIYTSTSDLTLLMARNATASSGTTIVLTDLAMRVDGFVLVGTTQNSNENITTSNSGADALTEDNETTPDTNHHFNSCSALTTENATTNDITSSEATSNVVKRMAGVSWSTTSFATTILDYYQYQEGVFSTSSVTFTSMPYGPPSATRMVIACIEWTAAATRTVSSATIGGVAATIVVQANGTAGGSAILTAAAVPGTFGDVAVTFDGVLTSGACHTFAATPASSTPVDSGTSNTIATSVTVTDIEVKNGGFLVCCVRNNGTGALSVVYNGTDTPTINDQFNTSAGSSRSAVWSVLTTQGVTTNDPGFSTVASVGKQVCAASWL